MNIKIGILNVPKHCNKHDLIHFVTDRLNPDLKASGPDDLSARVLNGCSAEITQVLACIFNQSFIHATVPDDWRQAIVAPTYKKGEKYDPGFRIRPLSLFDIYK